MERMILTSMLRLFIVFQKQRPIFKAPAPRAPRQSLFGLDELANKKRAAEAAKKQSSTEDHAPKKIKVMPVSYDDEQTKEDEDQGTHYL